MKFCSTLLTVIGFTVFACSTSAYADFRTADQAAKAKDWQAVVRACNAAAEAGEKNCQSHLGFLYKMGFGVQRDLRKSAELLSKCAAQGQMYCEEMLGDSYRNGLGVPQDFGEALRLFNSAAAKGNPWAFNNLANHYRLGQGVPRDPAQAARYYEIAADKGNGLGQANLADLYRLGEGVEKNGDKAFQLALKASAQNYGAAWNLLGLLYRDGVGVQQNTQRGIESFKKAIDPSVTYPATIAYSNLANLYFQGKGVPVDLEEAAKWAEAGARANQRDCMALWAVLLARGTRTQPVNKDLAYDWANRAYKLGAVSARNVLGYFHRDGIGTPVDFATARRLFEEGAAMGDINAIANLGRMYHEGEGAPKDPVKAHENFLLAQSQLDKLGPGNRKTVETYFTERAKSAQSLKATSVPDSSRSGAAAGPAAPVDSTQQALLERLEKMQKQLEWLQASANTINHNQVLERQTQLASRRALVIGNDTYQHVPQLLNARQDAAAIAKALGELGYTVSLHRDLTEKGFKQALREFRSTLEGGEEVLFFFAGHGVQLGAANYLLPVDMRGDNEDQVRDEAVELQRVLDDLKSKNSKFALAIIDACRDNPFKKSGRAIGGRGLAPTTAATGQMIMFSAGTGQQALDKLGNTDNETNGVFTRVLLQEMRKTGVPVDRVLRNVRNEVVKLAKSVGHEQTPALYDQAVGDFYFRP